MTARRCTHRLWDDPAGLPCTRTDPHHTGHTYTPNRGTETPDAHAAKEAMDT